MASSRIRKPLTVAILVAVAIVALLLLRAGFDLAAIVGWLQSVAGSWWAPLAFIALYALFNVLMVPGTILSLTAGVAWGWAAGGALVLVASTLGSLLPFAIASTASPPVARYLQRRTGRWYEKLRDEGFFTLLLLRLVPLVPYNALNYAAGLAGFRLRDYLAATLLGTIPGIFIFTWLADAIARGVVSPREAFARIALAGVLLAALAIATRFLSSRVRARVEK